MSKLYSRKSYFHLQPYVHRMYLNCLADGRVVYTFHFEITTTNKSTINQSTDFASTLWKLLKCFYRSLLVPLYGIEHNFVQTYTRVLLFWVLYAWIISLVWKVHVHMKFLLLNTRWFFMSGVSAGQSKSNWEMFILRMNKAKLKLYKLTLSWPR